MKTQYNIVDIYPATITPSADENFYLLLKLPQPKRRKYIIKGIYMVANPLCSI